MKTKFKIVYENLRSNYYFVIYENVGFLWNAWRYVTLNDTLVGAENLLKKIINNRKADIMIRSQNNIENHYDENGNIIHHMVNVK